MFRSSYHEHGGEGCDQDHHPDCPNPPGMEVCEPISATKFGCTHVFADGMEGAQLQSLTQAIAATFRLAALSQQAAAPAEGGEPGGQG